MRTMLILPLAAGSRYYDGRLETVEILGVSPGNPYWMVADNGHSYEKATGWHVLWEPEFIDDPKSQMVPNMRKGSILNLIGMADDSVSLADDNL